MFSGAHSRAAEGGHGFRVTHKTRLRVSGFRPKRRGDGASVSPLGPASV